MGEISDQTVEFKKTKFNEMKLPPIEQWKQKYIDDDCIIVYL